MLIRVHWAQSFRWFCYEAAHVCCNIYLAKGLIEPSGGTFLKTKLSSNVILVHTFPCKSLGHAQRDISLLHFSISAFEKLPLQLLEI